MRNRKMFHCIPLALSVLLFFAGCSQPHAPQQSSASALPQAASSATEDSSAPPASSQSVALEEAKAIALEHAGVSGDQADFLKVSEETEHGRRVFELEFRTDSSFYEYEIDGTSGEIRSSKQEALPEAAGEIGLTPEEAKALVLEWVPGAAEGDFREFESDYDDGRLVYEGELVYDGVEYEFEIDASTGARLSWEEDASHHH